MAGGFYQKTELGVAWDFLHIHSQGFFLDFVWLCHDPLD